jgi:hypothetical protein
MKHKKGFIDDLEKAYKISLSRTVVPTTVYDPSPPTTNAECCGHGASDGDSEYKKDEVELTS